MNRYIEWLTEEDDPRFSAASEINTALSSFYTKYGRVKPTGIFVDAVTWEMLRGELEQSRRYYCSDIYSPAEEISFFTIMNHQVAVYKVLLPYGGRLLQIAGMERNID